MVDNLMLQWKSSNEHTITIVVGGFLTIVNENQFSIQHVFAAVNGV